MTSAIKTSHFNMLTSKYTPNRLAQYFGKENVRANKVIVNKPELR